LARVYVIPVDAMAALLGVMLNLAALELPWGVTADGATLYFSGFTLNVFSCSVMVSAVVGLSAIMIYLLVAPRLFRVTRMVFWLVLASSVIDSVCAVLFMALHWNSAVSLGGGVIALLLSSLLKAFGAVYIRAPLGTLIVEIVSNDVDLP